MCSNVDLKPINILRGTCSFNGGVGALVVRVQNAGVAAEDVSVSFVDKKSNSISLNSFAG